MTVIDRARQDRAYLCFLPAGLLGILVGIANSVPVDTGTAGGIGFLLLIPLALCGVVFVPQGMYLTVTLRRDRNLIALSVLTVLWIAALLVDAGPALLTNLVSIAYGCIVSYSITMWFVRDRRRMHPA